MPYITTWRAQTIRLAHEGAGARDLDETMRAVAPVLPDATVGEVLDVIFAGAHPDERALFVRIGDLNESAEAREWAGR